MFTEEQIAYVKKRVESSTGILIPFETKVSAADNGLYVHWDGKQAEIRTDGINALARGFFLLARAVSEHILQGTRQQVRHFASCGTIVDVSRNAVLKVEAVKRHID